MSLNERLRGVCVLLGMADLLIIFVNWLLGSLPFPYCIILLTGGNIITIIFIGVIEYLVDKGWL